MHCGTLYDFICERERKEAEDREKREAEERREGRGAAEGGGAQTLVCLGWFDV